MGWSRAHSFSEPYKGLDAGLFRRMGMVRAAFDHPSLNFALRKHELGLKLPMGSIDALVQGGYIMLLLCRCLVS